MGYYSALTIVIVSSKVDVASSNMASVLINKYNFKSTGILFEGEFVYSRRNMLLVQINEEPISPPNLDTFFNPYAYVFLSRHSSSSLIPSVTVHSTGNFGKAELGGRDFEIGRSEPNLLKNVFLYLRKKEKELWGYKITYEATHHGPTSLSKPCIFLEIGSSEKEWRDAEAATYICEALIDAVEKGGFWEKVGIAFGGTHYPEKFNRFILENDIAVSYIVPKYVLTQVNEDLMDQMVRKSFPAAKYAIIDWKGLGTEKERLLSLVRKFGLEVIKL